MDSNKPLYVAKKSLAPAFTIWRVLFFWLIVPTIMIIVDIVKRKCTTIEFYDGYVIKKSGVIAKDEERMIFPKIVSVKIDRSVIGSIFNYGDIVVDAVGKWDLDLRGIKNPNEAKKYFEKHMLSPEEVAALPRQQVFGGRF